MPGVKTDRWIREMAVNHKMIEPFSERVAGPNIISFGLQPCGYDARLAPEVQIFEWARAQGAPLDPLKVNPDLYFDRPADPFIMLPPRGYMVGLTVEYFCIPRNCTARGVSKTTYSSVGVNIDVAGINPGWEGRLRLHISNPGPIPIKIYGGMGIIYLEFHEIDGVVERDYSQLAHTRFQKQTEAFAKHGALVPTAT